MAFSDLYEAVQDIEGKISTRDLTDLAIKYSEINHVQEMWSDVIVDESLRGFYIEGPLGPPVPVAEHGALIVLSRAMIKGPNGKHWRHLVYTKELMHVFDREEEKAGTPETFDIQIQRFADPTKEMSPQFRAESKAVWRALLVLCQQDSRMQYQAEYAAGIITLDMLAAALRIPISYAHYLIQDNFEDIAAHVMDG